MLRGRSAAQKRALIAELTRVMAEVAGVNPERVNVVIVDVEADSWGRAGMTLSETETETSAAL